jgi:hypothetical protein
MLAQPVFYVIVSVGLGSILNSILSTVKGTVYFYKGLFILGIDRNIMIVYVANQRAWLSENKTLSAVTIST